MPRYLPPQALAHPYLGSLHDSSDEPLAHASFYPYPYPYPYP